MGNKVNYTKLSLQLHYLISLHYFQKTRRSLFAVLSLFLLFLLAYNGATIFCIHIPFLAKTPPEPARFSPENVAGETTKFVSLSSFRKLSSSVMYALKEENPPAISNTHLPILHKSQNLVLFMNKSLVHKPKRKRKSRSGLKAQNSEARINQFSRRVKEFFGDHSSNYSCKFRFFMTWISSLESFGDRDLFTIESLFKSHPNGCLVIVSNSMDSTKGLQILSPFLEKGFKVTAISPDFNYLFKNTVAESWFDQLMRGNVNPGEVSLGQNLSNVLRLGLLYKFGGIYIDTDFIILKSFGKLRNSIGAQTVDLETKNWSRLNNAVMIFDKGHPLLYKFIQEFALTFDGNKWGHNGPYLVSRVVSRVNGRPGFNFTVLSPTAFYPVDWSRIGSLFRGPKNATHSKWLLGKLRQIRRQSFAVHLWNKQSRRLEIEEGSIIGSLISDRCVFCNSSASAL